MDLGQMSLGQMVLGLMGLGQMSPTGAARCPINIKTFIVYNDYMR